MPYPIKFLASLVVFALCGACSKTLFATDSTSTSPHAIVLKEVDKIIVNGNKSSFMQITFAKRLKIKVLDNDGIADYAEFLVPQMHDKHIPSQAPEINNIQPVLPFANLDYFSYKIDGKQMEFPEIKSEEIRRVADEQFVYSTLTTAILRDLKPGSIVEIEYKVSAPFQYNWSAFLGYRVFFHGKYPKKDYTFQLSVPEGVVFELQSVNGAKYRQKNAKSYSEIEVKLKNLAGCIDEPGARPYAELPHLIFVPVRAGFVPHYILQARYRERSAISIQNAFDAGMTDLNILSTRNFIAKQDKTDYTIGGSLASAHNLVANNFEFLDDSQALAMYDNRMLRVGKHLLIGKLRNLGRFDAYRHLFAALKLRYNTVYTCDKRFGELSTQYVYPIRTNDYLFLTKSDGKNTLIYPKKSDIGYYLNELPFYFEGTRGIRITLDDLFPNEESTAEVELDPIDIDKTDHQFNIRKIETKVELNLNGPEHFTSDVSLSGQFSTNGRHAYLGKGCDKTINPMYGQSPSILLAGFENIEVNVKKQETTPPFEFSCSNEFKAEVATIKAGSVSIHLSHLFPFIIENKEVSLPRHLGYFPDFQYADEISYEFQLDGNYKLSDFPSFQIENSFGSFSLTAKLISSNVLQLTAKKTVSAEYIPASSVLDIIEIEQAIKKLEKATVELKQS